MSAPTGQARPIVGHGAPILHQRCPAVTGNTCFDQPLAELVADLFASMYAAAGVGLAANQIGIPARVFVYDCPDATGKRHTGHVVNPVLHLPAPPRALDHDIEGCLSIPGRHAELARPTTATLTGVDLHGDPVRLDGTGLLARCFQHEVDHLNGLLYVDRLPARHRKQLLTK